MAVNPRLGTRVVVGPNETEGSIESVGMTVGTLVGALVGKVVTTADVGMPVGDRVGGHLT